MKSLLFRLIFFTIIFLSITGKLFANKNEREYYCITIYHFKDSMQENILDNYIQAALIPAVHKNHHEHIGVFKPLANDTAKEKLLYLIIPGKSLKDVTTWSNDVMNDADYVQASAAYINASYKNPPYVRMENILLYAFHEAPVMQMPQLKNSVNEKIYELRSYEGPTEKYFYNKVDMFNAGGEVPLFKRLGFNAIFYASVIAGSHQPNLMYMTSFESMQEREAHWKTFSNDAQWKALSSDAKYQNNISHIDITFLHATPYSDY